ncbi:UNVERIFIED_CONTAM: hypothetical protein Sindi_0960300 [Sesamum indicum]
MIQLTQEALLTLIRDVSTRAAAQAVAQFVAQQPVNPPPPSPCRSRELSSAPEEEEQRREEVNSRISRPEVVQSHDQNLPNRESSAPPPHQLGELRIPTCRLLWHLRDEAHLPPIFWPRRSQSVSRCRIYPEYDGAGDPQEHLDKFYAKIDWYDLSDAAYCKVFRTTLSKRALAWFNQLPAGTISSLEQLVQRFLHHFSMNKKIPKTASYLFTVRQREGETLRDFMQRFVDAVHEVPHVNQELLASIVQQNLQLGRFKESIAGKPPSTMEDLIVRSQKYIRIEESNAMDPSFNNKRKGREEEKESKKKEERKHGPKHQPRDSTSKQAGNGDNLPTAGVIAVISGGPAGGDSANARRALTRAARGVHAQTPIQLGIDNAELRKVTTPLTGFSSDMIQPMGEVMLPLSLGSHPKRSTKLVKFLVVKAPSAYNVILGETEPEPLPERQHLLST